MRRAAAIFVALALGACASRRPRPSDLPSPVPLPSATPAPTLIVPTLIVPPRSSTCLPLDAAEAPLLAILETPTPVAPVGFLVTIAPFAYTSKLAAWESIYPEGSPARAAILAHERVHAQRQGADPVSWCARYQADAAFRLAEEKLGYGAQIATLVHAGATVDVDSFVAALTDPFYGGMISADDARAWIAATIASAGS